MQRLPAGAVARVDRPGQRRIVQSVVAEELPHVNPVILFDGDAVSFR